MVYAFAPGWSITFSRHYVDDMYLFEDEVSFIYNMYKVANLVGKRFA